MSQQCSRYNFGHAQDASRHHICEILYHDFHSYKVQKRPGFHFRTQKVSKLMNLQAWMSNRLTVTKQQKHALLHINLSNKMACMFRIWWYLPWPQPLYPVSNQLQCKNKICQNGGMCYILGDENMSQCVCRPGWKGPTCLIGGTSCFQILLPSLRGSQVRDLGPKRRWWARVCLHCDQETAFRVQPRDQVNLLTTTKDIKLRNRPKLLRDKSSYVCLEKHVPVVSSEFYYKR